MYYNNKGEGLPAGRPVFVRESALKRGIDPSDALTVARHPLGTSVLDEDQLKLLCVGFDDNAAALEVVIKRTHRGWLLIYAMKLRKKYWPLLLQGTVDTTYWEDG
ncbi:toxin [Bifidobacterium primatium]|uniref:Toxin n=1 Tax=Bifidobacterium primatium TaxID=2045438 RepID=A0A2M9H6G2_9BIFI|nr:toxin [Bifidobacterium primatium]PJM72404.1 toxin [Bifidobacterium primatium]